MSRGAFSLDKDGGLKISEVSVVDSSVQLVTLYGYEPNRAEANTVTRGKNPHGVLKNGTLDFIMAHPRWPAFYCEFKRRRSGTNKERRLLQVAEVDRLRRAGYRVFLAAENDPDPNGTFKMWFLAMVKEVHGGN